MKTRAEKRSLVFLISSYISEMVKTDSELKEVKEKLCTLTASVRESKDEGQLN